MKNNFILIFFILIGLTITGCAGKKPMYYFGDYSKTYYTYVKKQNDESLSDHKQELERVISESEKEGIPVPPGIYAELGYLNLMGKNTKEAVRLFQVELKLYPESRVLMERLIQKAQTSEKDEAAL